MKMPNLVGVHELVDLLDVNSRQHAQQISRKPSFPEPVARLAAGPVWERESVLAWIRENWRKG